MKNFNHFSISFFVLLFTLSCLNDSYAKVWRVNNRIGVDADFSSVQDAIDASAAGDTIYIEGSPDRYGNSTLNKQLVLIGPGIFLGENPNTQAYLEDAELGSVRIDATSSLADIVLVGLRTSNLNINSDNVTIKRCKTGSIDIRDQNNVLVEQSYTRTIVVDDCSNIVIRNNYIDGLTNAVITDDILSPNITVQNNVIRENISIENTIFINNILIEGNFTETNSMVSYNLGNAIQFPNQDGNQQNIDMSTVFVDVNGTVDNDFLLKAGSPAIGAGSNGGDCGMFSSDNLGNPYILSGMPAIPSIHAITVPDVGFNTLNINVKSVTHN